MTVTYFAILIVTVLEVNGYHSIPINDPNHQKNIDLVEVIRQDLQRNNDDYKEMTKTHDKYNNNKTLTHNMFTTNISSNHSEAKSRTLNVIRNLRRKFVQNNSTEQEISDIGMFDTGLTIETTTKPPKTNIRAKPLKFSATSRKKRKYIIDIKKTTVKKSKINPLKSHKSTESLNIKPKDFSSKVKRKSKKRVPKDNYAKFKQFIRKNKAILKEFLNSKSKEETTKILRKGRKTKKQHRHRAKHLREKSDKYDEMKITALPGSNMLDMAPAKGGHVNVLRLHGRLCHRHVLFPEGPKYDSKGRSYLPAHEVKLKRPYPATNVPVLLLPRCCNCCKKSVLGCQ